MGLSMTFDELQKNYWQKDTAGSKLTIDSDMLIREVKRNKEAFESCVFWRDFREVAVAIILVVVFLYTAVKSKDNLWVAGSLVIVAIMCLYVAAFFLIDRHLQRKKKPRHTDPLLGCIESSLLQVNHQIWLLKNVFWWYLLPPGAGIFLFFIVVTWNVYKVLHSSHVLLMFGANLLFVTIVFWGGYWLNQYAVHKTLNPRRQELETMLKNLANNDNAMPS
jgi:predicted Na+-dependent transporter